MRPPPFLIGLAPLLALVATTGCGAGPKLVPVTGKAMHKNQPLTAGTIFFHPAVGNASKEERSTCLLETDGSFVMRTYPYGNGVPPGAYKVTFSPDLANRVKLPHYADPEKTPLSIDVPETGVHDLVFNVK